METSKFKVGDIVILTPSEDTMRFINAKSEYKKYIGEEGEIMESFSSWKTASIKFFNVDPPGPINWYFEDLTLAKELRKTEVSGEV